MYKLVSASLIALHIKFIFSWAIVSHDIQFLAIAVNKCTHKVVTIANVLQCIKVVCFCITRSLAICPCNGDIVIAYYKSYDTCKLYVKQWYTVTDEYSIRE